MTTERLRVPAASPFAEVVGYSRAVRVGSQVVVSGTAPWWPDGSCPDDAGRQAERVIEIILAALAQAGAGPEHVVRTRIYVTDAEDWEAVGRVHAGAFGLHPPATSMVVVAGLLDPRWRVEMEAEADLG